MLNAGSMAELVDTIRRWYNKVRIWFLERFTDRVRRFKAEMPDGSEHDFTIENREVKQCAHRKLEQISETMWKCIEERDCDWWFEIPWKLAAQESQVIGHLDKIAKRLGYEWDKDLYDDNGDVGTTGQGETGSDV